jgi:hypothetical protein
VGLVLSFLLDCLVNQYSWSLYRRTRQLTVNRALGAIGAAFDAPGPYHRPFSLVDLGISFPYVEEQIPIWLLVVVSIVAPAIIVFVGVMIFVPGPTASRDMPNLAWRKKFWEWNGESLNRFLDIDYV